MDRSVSIMRSRIDKLGVSEPEIRKQGKDQIVIQLAGVHDAGKAAQIIGKTAQLQFYDLENDVVPARRPTAPAHVVADASLYDLLTPGAGGREEGHADGVLPLQRRRSSSVAGPEETREKLLDSTTGRQADGKVPKGIDRARGAGDRTVVISCVASPTNGCPGVTAPLPARDRLLPLQVRPDRHGATRSRRRPAAT